MRETTYSFAKNLFSPDQIKGINEQAKKSFISGSDYLATSAKKSSNVKFLYLGSIQKFILPFLDYCFSVNNSKFGFDLFQLSSQTILNYNSYAVGTEYSWHVDAESKSPIRDIKLTCLLNLSEEKFDGGDLYLFKGEEVKCSEFKEPGSAIVFPSFTNHRVDKLVSGSRSTLAIWMTGPKFR
tara:strand:+ start:530 stop:1075 length:546 start_codon:yes stop_codon:yes gene_type:complete